jgi:hypothetical protein
MRAMISPEDKYHVICVVHGRKQPKETRTEAEKTKIWKRLGVH